MTRGERLNNPGNIRKDINTHWQGSFDTSIDPDFVEFVSPEYGIRAIVKILRSYKRQGINTIAEAINHWAPSVENNTQAYIDAVCKDCGLLQNDPVDFDSIMPILVRAIIHHENGEVIYSETEIAQGVALA
jgi:hypothetical protein